MSPKTNAIILARVSSKSQEDEGYSLDSQLKLLQGYCQSKGLVIVKVFKIAETASKEQSRKTFQELLVYISKNKIYHLAVEKTDRLTRNLHDAVAIDDWLSADANRRLHAVKENLLLHKDARSDVKFMWNIHLAVAKKYTDNLREEAMKGWAEKLAQGWLPAVPPPGYMTITQNGKRIHVPDPDTKPIMHRVFSLYLDPSHSISSIAFEMERLGLRTRKGRPYSKSHVQKILMNPFYIGINRFDGKDYPGAQEPIISKELFDKVQQKMHHGKPTVYRAHNPILKNLITCEGCNGTISWELHKGRYYGACQRTKDSCRRRKFLREDKVEAAIIEQLQQLVCPSPEIIDWVANEMRMQSSEDIEARDRMLASIQAQIERLGRMDSQLYDDKLSGDITKEKYDEKHQQFVSQKAELETQQAKLDKDREHGLEQRLVLLELSQKAASLYQHKAPEQKRIIITELFGKITSKDSVVSVSYTNFASVIAQNVLKTKELIGV